MQQKHVCPNMLVHMLYAPYVCQTAGASIIGGGAYSWITERHYQCGVRMLQTRSGRAPKELKMMLTLFKNGLVSK